MALDRGTFENLKPSYFISFTFPNPTLPNFLLRVAVLDSPNQPTNSPTIAAMFVPKSREDDWIFSTESGHFQLLLNSPGISRLILVGNQPTGDNLSSAIYHRLMETESWDRLEMNLKPLFLALSPKSCFKNGIPEIHILSYEDNLICSVVLEKCIGSFVGEMLVEDVEIESEFEVGKFQKREFRRRLRFKRMPNLIQTEIRIVPSSDFSLEGVGIGEIEFKPDIGVLVHPYLAPMLASLSLTGYYIEDQIQSGFRPKALCIGVGGGALLSFLGTILEFEVAGVEADKEVLRIARQYFGLKDDKLIQVYIGDAIEFLENIAYRTNGGKSNTVCEIEKTCHLDGGMEICKKFDVIMVDLDASDAREGASAPSMEFVKKHVLLAARSVLCEFGILVINVIPPNELFYERLLRVFQEVFLELYQIDVGNGENYVLIAAVSRVMPSIDENKNSFMKQLRLLISGAYMDSIRKI